MGFILGNIYNLPDIITLYICFINYIKSDFTYPKIEWILRNCLDNIESLSNSKVYEFEVSIINSTLTMKSYDLENAQYLLSKTILFEVDIIIKKKQTKQSK
jgi:hypothetical protein